jgi:hypothetical protein
MKYLKIWTSFFDLIGQLQYDEIGRLFEAMLIYADSGKEPEEFGGNERFLWPVAKQQIDLTAERNEILRQNGMRGGRPKTKETKDNQTKPNETKENQSKAVKERKEKERKGKDFEDDTDTRAREDISFQQIQSDHNRVLDAAEDAGFKMSNDVRGSLIALFAEHGMEKILRGLKECVDHGAPNLAYLKAVLNGKPKTKPVQDFQQRDYSGEQDAAMERMIAWAEENSRTG